MKVTEYFNKKEQYSMPNMVDSIGSVVDTKTKNELAIGVHIHRDVYSGAGYICNEDAPEILHACVCALLEQIHEMPIIKTVLLKPEMIYEAIGDENEITEEIVRYSNMTLCALHEAFKGYLYENERKIND